MNLFNIPSKCLCVAAALIASTSHVYADLTTDIQQLQHRWAEVNYILEGKEQNTAYESLIAKADSSTGNYPDAAQSWIWSGIIKSSYAGAKGGLGALSLAKASKKDLEKALSIDPESMSGSAYTSLGTLYNKVPGWPLGFGSDDKARELLQKALAINPDGIDTNYFYAEFLRDQGDYREAKTYLQKAMQAAPRPSRPLADSGRRNEIKLALQQLEKKLEK